MKRRNRKYYTLLFSYLLIMVVPLICSAFLHIYNKSLVNRQAQEMTESMLTSIKKQMDMRVNHIWQIGILAAQMDTIVHGTQTNVQDGQKAAYEHYLMSKELEKISSYTDGVKDVLVYIKDADKIVASGEVMTTEMYSNLFLDQRITDEAVREMFSACFYKECMKLPNKSGSNDLFFIISDWTSLDHVPRYAVAVVIEETVFTDLIQSICWMDEAAVVICDTSGNEILQSGDMMEGLKKAVENKGAKIEEDGYQILTDSSDVMDWDYYVAVPQSSIEKNSGLMQRYYLVMLFACIFVGFAIASILTSRNYHPIRILSDLISQYKKYNGGGGYEQEDDNYQWLQKQTEAFFEERVNTMQVLKRNKRELRNYYLLRLLENSYTEDLDENLEKYQIAFPYPFFTVIQFMIEDKQSQDGQMLMHFVLKNIFKELMEGQGILYMVHVGERIVGIANMEGRSQMAVIQEKVRQMQELVDENFHYEITALLGGCYASRNEIFKAYENTCEIQDYIALLEDNLICYEDVKGRDKKYWYNAELNQKLFNAVKTGNLEIAKEHLHQVLRQNSVGKFSLSVYRCLIFDLLGTILRAAEDGGYHGTASENDVLEKVSVRLSKKQIEQTFGELLETVCSEIKQKQKETGQNQDLSVKIQQYIQENYRNVDLNVSLTAQYFQMSPSYLSSIYKKQTGKSLLEYINQIRLDEAERLLEQGFSVTEVAEKAGFRDSTYLIRVFKKKKGMTPGQKRQIS